MPEKLRFSLQISGLLLLLVIGVLGMSGAAQAKEDTGHFQTECVNCHLSPGNPAPEQAHRLTGSQQQLCGSCHGDVAEASHPVGFVPDRALPKEFPLDERGQMNCSTCHDLHAENQNAENQGRIRLAKRGRELCTSCHAENFFTGMADSGDAVMVSGHFGASSRVGGSLGGPVDSYSMQCMACHSDNATVNSRRVASLGFMRPIGGGGSNHPIGADYRQASFSGGFNPPSSLPAEMVLPEGKVSCITCHKPFSRKHGEVRRAATLCTQCHIK